MKLEDWPIVVGREDFEKSLRQVERVILACGLLSERIEVRIDQVVRLLVDKVELDYIGT